MKLVEFNDGAAVAHGAAATTAHETAVSNLQQDLAALTTVLV